MKLFIKTALAVSLISSLACARPSDYIIPVHGVEVPLNDSRKQMIYVGQLIRVELPAYECNNCDYYPGGGYCNPQPRWELNADLCAGNGMFSIINIGHDYAILRAEREGTCLIAFDHVYFTSVCVNDCNGNPCFAGPMYLPMAITNTSFVCRINILP